MTERRAVIVDVVRTPFGKGRESGVLAGHHPVDLLAGVIEEFGLTNSFTNAFPARIIIASYRCAEINSSMDEPAKTVA